MKKLLCLLALVPALTGCAAADQAMEQALAFRGALLGAEQVRFQARITADYIDHAEQFTLSCTGNGEGAVAFEVDAPEEIAGITGTVAGTEGTLRFDDTILAFPLMDDDSLSPVSGPWVMLSALRSGCITACTREGELLRLTVDEGYGDDALTVDVWLRGESLVAAEISWRGRRQLTMELENFGLV